MSVEKMPTKMEDTPRIERLIAMAERLIVALESDIAELKDGRTAALKTNDPEIQKLTVLYGREAQGFDLRIAQAAAPSLRQRFVAITLKFREVLQLHARMIAKVKNASEGIVRAIAAEVERANAPTRTYGPRPGQAPQSSGPMLFNRVV
jgi:hypothetical protein